MRCPRIRAGTQSWQTRQKVSLFSSAWKCARRSSKHSYDNVFTLGPPSCVCDHSFGQNARSGVSEKVLAFCHRKRPRKLLGKPTWHVTEERSSDPLVDCDPSGTNGPRHPFLRSIGIVGTNVVDSHLVYEVVSPPILARWKQKTGSNFFAMPKPLPGCKRLC